MTTKIKNLIDNINALRIKLTKDELKEISDAVPVNEVARVRSNNFPLTYKLADTSLPKNGQAAA
ncbi:conserved hypothetical protein [Ricinus communis]|uniref:Uncharacterized protein n=1 Tax=Ricinus communis TaxID=3988 RepID=B9REQ0_RICCO|nr:conserved hypothetical protein [Ricinus communis]